MAKSETATATKPLPAWAQVAIAAITIVGGTGGGYSAMEAALASARADIDRVKAAQDQSTADMNLFKTETRSAIDAIQGDVRETRTDIHWIKGFLKGSPLAKDGGVD